VIEPRKGCVVGADVVIMAEGSTEAPRWAGAEVPPGSKSRACAQQGSPGTWESLSSPRGNRHEGQPVYTKSLAHGGSARPPTGAKYEREEWYCQAKDNEVRRDGRQAVGTPRTTDEAGELTRRTRWREGGVGLRDV
jgi:hypothetical protein